MGISDPNGPFSPYGRVGSVVNVVFSAVMGAAAIVVGAVQGNGAFILGGLIFWGLCLFAFVPIMRRARRQDRQ